MKYQYIFLLLILPTFCICIDILKFADIEIENIVEIDYFYESIDIKSQYNLISVIDNNGKSFLILFNDIESKIFDTKLKTYKSFMTKIWFPVLDSARDISNDIVDDKNIKETTILITDNGMISLVSGILLNTQNKKIVENDNFIILYSETNDQYAFIFDKKLELLLEGEFGEYKGKLRGCTDIYVFENDKKEMILFHFHSLIFSKKLKNVIHKQCFFFELHEKSIAIYKIA